MCLQDSRLRWMPQYKLWARGLWINASGRFGTLTSMKTLAILSWRLTTQHLDLPIDSRPYYLLHRVVRGSPWYVRPKSKPPLFLDFSIVSNAGQYLSVDSRPVSGSKGSLKHIISTYKSYLRSGSSVESFQNFKDPFLYLHIICPSGSYDANVEPAKDDVLFSDADFVIATLHGFLESIYGELQTPKAGSRPGSNSKPGAFDLLLARKPRPTESSLWNADRRGRKIPSNTYNVGEQVNDYHVIGSNTVQRTQDSDEEKALRDVEISNPWTFAKIHTSVRHSNTSNRVELQRPNDQLLTPARQAGELTDDTRERLQEQRQSYVPTSSLPTPARTQAGHSTPSSAQPSPAHNPFSFPQKVWLKNNDENAPRKDSTSQRGLYDQEIVREDETRRRQTRGRDFVSARTLSLEAPPDGIPELQADRIRGLMPRERLGTNSKKGSFSTERVLPNIRLVRNNASAFARFDSNSINDSILAHSISFGNPDLVASKGDERRKQGTLQAIQRLKPMTEPRAAHVFQENSHPSSSAIPSPHKNRQTLQTLYLLENTPAAASRNPNPKEIFEQGDPRAYLLHSFQQQRNNDNEILNSSSAHHGPSRNREKTSPLPLEAIPEELTTRDLILVIPTTKLDINGLLAGLRSKTSEDEGFLLDEYIASAEFVGAFLSSSSESNNKSSMRAHRYESKIRALLASVYGNEVSAEHDKLRFSDLRSKS